MLEKKLVRKIRKAYVIGIQNIKAYAFKKKI